MTAIVATSALHVALSAGFGAGHGFLGPQLELKVGHFALDAGIGLADSPFADFGEGLKFDVSPAVGLRYFLREEGSGPYLSAHFAYFTHNEGNSSPNQPFEDRERQVYGATIGWRLQHVSGLFLDAGIGMAFQIFHRHGVADTADGLRGFDERRVGAGWVWRPGTVPYPDVDFAIGFEF